MTSDQLAKFGQNECVTRASSILDKPGNLDND
jgi:hypothetical protein